MSTNPTPQEVVEGRRQRGEMIVKSYYGHTEGSIYDMLIDLFTYAASARKMANPAGIAKMAAGAAQRDIEATYEGGGYPL